MSHLNPHTHFLSVFCSVMCETLSDVSDWQLGDTVGSNYQKHTWHLVWVYFDVKIHRNESFVNTLWTRRGCESLATSADCQFQRWNLIYFRVNSLVFLLHSFSPFSIWYVINVNFRCWLWISFLDTMYNFEYILLWTMNLRSHLTFTFTQVFIWVHLSQERDTTSPSME